MSTPPDQEVLSVSELNRQARVTIEQRFQVVWVTGELSNFARPRSGHWYFSLKDSAAQVRCAMFANRNRAVQMQPMDGQQVLIRGRVSLYEGRGDFQIIAEYMEPAGEGALRQAFEQLKIKLDAEGLFAREKKKDLPRFPRHCAVITSPGAAALKDVLSIWRRRYPALQVTLVPAMVQGEAAVPQLIHALGRAQAQNPDVILLTRGGGSLEDLWCFNAEPLARAIHAATIPVVSAVGHEIDTTIADLVADLRAPTPSAAAELITPDGMELAQEFRGFERYFLSLAERYLNHQQLRVDHQLARLKDPATLVADSRIKVEQTLARARAALVHQLRMRQARVDSTQRQLRNLAPKQQIARHREHIHNLLERQRKTARQHIDRLSRQLAGHARMLHQLSPLPTLDRGYSVIQDEQGRVLSSVQDITAGQALVARLKDGSVQATVDATSTETLGERLPQPQKQEGMQEGTDSNA